MRRKSQYEVAFCKSYGPQCWGGLPNGMRKCSECKTLRLEMDFKCKERGRQVED